MAEPLDLGRAPTVTVDGSDTPKKSATWSFFPGAEAAEFEGGKIGETMKSAGFSDGEVADWRAKHTQEMRAAGFTQDEIDKDFGIKHPDMSLVQKHVADSFDAHAKAEADAAAVKPTETTVKPPPTKPAQLIPDQSGAPTPGQPPVPATTVQKPEDWYTRLTDAAGKGWGSSITGMVENYKLPESLPEDSSWAEKMAYGTASVAGDVPFMIGGVVGGGLAGSAVPGVGNVVGAGIGAFAVPAMIRRSLIDNMQKGSIKDTGDFAQRSMAILYDGVKQGTVGALTTATGGIAGAATRAAGPIISGTAQTAAELATMVTAGKALEGQLPSADDFTVGAAMVLALHGATKTGSAVNSVTKNLQDIYYKTGLNPKVVAEMAKNDPTIAQDIVIGGGVPAALADHVDPTLRPNTIPTPSAEFVNTAKVVPPEPPAGLPPSTGPLVAGQSPAPWDNVASHIDFKGQDKATPWSWNSLYTKVVDDIHPIFVDQKAMLKSLNTDLTKLPADQQPYLLAQNSRGTFGRAEQQLEHSTYDFDTYKNNGAGLKEILKPIKDDMKDWATYAVSKRALELEARGINSGLPLADAQAVVASGAARFEAINNAVVAYQNRVSKQLLDSGIISKEMYAAMLDANKNYTPFFRVLDGEAGGVGIGGGLNTSNPIHGIKGSDKDIVNPLESIVKNTYVYTALAERNAVGKAYLDLANATGHGEDWITKVSPPLKSTTVADKEMQKFLKDNGIEGVPEELLTVFRALRTPLEKDQIAVFTDGKREVYKLNNPETAEAFTGMDRGTSNLIVKVLSVPAAAMRAGATSLNPDFFVRNAMTDQVTSFIYGNNIPVVDWLRGVMSLAKKEDNFQNFLKGGGANSAMVSIDRTYLRDKLKAMNLERLDGETGLMSRAWNVAKTPLDVLQIIGETMENTTRLGVMARNTKGDTKADILQAANMAREGTLDFAKKGSQVRAMNMITDFFSANVNGTDKMIRMAKDNPSGFAVKVFAGITLPSILLYEANKDDPRYNEIPQWQKDLFYIVMTDNHIFRIKKDFGLGVVFGSGAEHMLKAYDDYNKGKSLDTQSLSNYFAQVWGSLMPPVTPTAVRPIVEQATNTSFFTGQRLVPDSKEKLLPEYQYNDYTSELTKKIGGMIGAIPGMRSDFAPDQAKALASPIVIDNYVRQWTGNMGNYVVQLADYGLRKAGILNDPVTATATLADIPVVKAFVVRHPSSQAQPIQDFYQHEANNQKFYDTVRQLAKAGDLVSLQKELGLQPGDKVDFVKLNQAAAQLDRMPGLKTALGNMSMAVHAINLNPGIKPDEKRQLIDTIYNQMIQTSAAGNAAFRQIDDALGRSMLKPKP